MFTGEPSGSGLTGSAIQVLLGKGDGKRCLILSELNGNGETLQDIAACDPQQYW
jgi:hypothetical protein